MRRIANIFVLTILAAPVLSASPKAITADDIKLSDISMTVDEVNNNVRVRLDLAVEHYKVGANREIILTPMLIADDMTDSLMLDEIIVAGRNRWYQYMRDGMLDGGDANIFRAGKKSRAHIDAEFPYQPWMAHASLEMRAETANCCNAPERMAGPSNSGNVVLARLDMTRPTMAIDYVFAPPVDAGPVIKSIEGSAFVTFIVNRTDLLPNYMKNRSELDKIISSIEYVRRDSDATITHVHVKGFASPDGPYDNNVRLSQGRTETLRRYVRDLYRFPDTTVTSSYEPEDWAGLRAYVADSMNYDISHRAEILSIIDGPLGFDNKDLAIKTQFPADYAVILHDIYPWLRRSDYKVTYAIRTYTDLAEISRVYNADPTRLRNVDFYTLAQTYPVGSDEYCNVFETAVAVYPDDPMLNLNAANIALDRGELDIAQSHLLKAGNTPQANYARGILAERRNDYNEALKRFRSAADGGMTGVEAIIGELETIRDYSPVSYEIQPIEK